MSSTEWATPGLSPFMPNAFVDIKDYLQKKLEALAAYHGDASGAALTKCTHAEVLARHRGSCVGLEAAEGFILTRFLE